MSHPIGRVLGHGFNALDREMKIDEANGNTPLFSEDCSELSEKPNLPASPFEFRHCREYECLLTVTAATVRESSICKTMTSGVTTGQRINQTSTIRRDASTAAVSTSEKLVFVGEQCDEQLSSYRRELSESVKLDLSSFDPWRIGKLPLNASGKVDYGRHEGSL